jgi:hypothetical protein
MQGRKLRPRFVSGKEVDGVGYKIVGSFGGGGVSGCIKIQSTGYGFVWLLVKAEIENGGASWHRFFFKTLLFAAPIYFLG